MYSNFIHSGKQDGPMFEIDASLKLAPLKEVTPEIVEDFLKDDGDIIVYKQGIATGETHSKLSKNWDDQNTMCYRVENGMEFSTPGDSGA